MLLLALVCHFFVFLILFMSKGLYQCLSLSCPTHCYTRTGFGVLWFLDVMTYAYAYPVSLSLFTFASVGRKLDVSRRRTVLFPANYTLNSDGLHLSSAHVLLVDFSLLLSTFLLFLVAISDNLDRTACNHQWKCRLLHDANLAQTFPPCDAIL